MENIHVIPQRKMFPPMRLFFPVDYNPVVDTRWAEYQQKREKAKEIERTRRLRRQREERDLAQEEFLRSFDDGGRRG